jgi:hypothetical protein
VPHSCPGRADATSHWRLLLEVNGHAQAVVAAVQEAVRVDLGIRVEAVPVPGQSLPRYELKARRLVRRASE